MITVSMSIGLNSKQYNQKNKRKKLKRKEKESTKEIKADTENI